MRTFPKSLAAFRKIVDKRGEELRMLQWEQIIALEDEPTQHIELEGRRATISIIVQPERCETLRVVIQGFMKHKFFPGTSAALDGFYKHRNGDVTPMGDEEFYEYY